MAHVVPGPAPPSSPAISQDLPRVIWTAWFQGWANAPRLVKACRATWEVLNPGWEVRALSNTDVARYVNLADTYDGMRDIWLPAQHHVDFVRTALLRDYGGVWADATLYCTRPLDEWLYDAMPEGFFAFSRAYRNHPVASWFVASTPQNYMIESWRRSISEYWYGRDSSPNKWLHRLFAELCRSDPYFASIWDRTPHMLADGPGMPHHFAPYPKELPRPVNDDDKRLINGEGSTVFKLTHKLVPRPNPDDPNPPQSVYEYLCATAEARAGLPGPAAGHP